MNIRKALFSLFLCSGGSFLAALILLLPGLIWPESMILFGLLALILYLYVTLPLHGVTLITLLYASFKYRVFGQVFGYYSYFFIWTAINAVVFQDFLFVEIPEKFKKWHYEQTYEDELTLLRLYRNGLGSTDKAKELLAKGTDPNITDYTFGISALTWAAYRATAADVEVLIGAGANVNDQVDQNFSGGPNSIVQFSIVAPLILATLNNNKDERYKIVSLLLDKGATPRVGEPVLGACGQGDVDLLELLIKNDADLWVRDIRNKGCFYYAADSGYPKLIEYLLGKSLERDLPIDPLDQNVTPSLVDIAATRGHADVVIELTRAGYKATQPERIERLLQIEPVNSENKRQLETILETYD